MSYSAKTYATILADILEATEDRSTRFMSMLDTIIGKAETRVLKDLDLKFHREEMSGGNLVVGTRTKAKPAGCVKVDSVFITVSSALVPLEERTFSYCQLYAPNPATQSQPLFYAEIDDDTLYVAPTPDLTYALTVQGLKRPTGLSSIATTTWLSTNVADLLLDACLIESEAFLTNPKSIGIWSGRYNDSLGRALLELRGVALGAPPAPPIEVGDR